MSSNKGRPTDDPKSRGYRIRMSDKDLEKLDYLSKFYGKTKAEIIRHGIDMIYRHAKQSPDFEKKE